MNEFYLATNLEPLKAIGEGKVLGAINNVLNNYNENSKVPAELAAYCITGSLKIKIIICLFKTENGLMYRRFDFYSSVENVEDDLMLTAKYGLGIHYVDIERFLEVRDFYLEHTT